MKGLIVDLFAGGGGASAGIEAAMGRSVDVAINHDEVAIAVHRANHPESEHLETDIWEVRPKVAVRGRPVDLLWASPDCTHFSVAKGGKPRKQGIRSLAWAVVRWAKDVRPAVILLENVGEFRGWGPLETTHSGGCNGREPKRSGRRNGRRAMPMIRACRRGCRFNQPILAQKGSTFVRWRRQLERLGYVVDHRVLDASQFGAPTRRRRLFLVARCDGQPIRWPEPTHGPGLQPFRTAAECIDWSIPCPSIFERKRPLAPKTLWRIAQGIRRFVLDTADPFIVTIDQQGARRAETGADAPVPTIVTKNRTALVVPTIVGVGGRAGQSRPTGPGAPLGAVTAKNDRAIVTPTIIPMNANNPPMQIALPLGTVTSQHNRFGMVAPTLMQVGYGERQGQEARVPGLDKPVGTVVGTGKHALVSAFLAKHFGGVVGTDLDVPAGTVTTRDHHGLAAATLVKFRGNEKNGHPGCADARQPLPTVAAGGNHVAEVRAFLTAFYGSDGTAGKGQSLRQPARTVRSKHCLGLVTVRGQDYQIVDIGMRMLEPHELLAAQFGRFAPAYDLSAATTKAAKVRLIGNSVCPEVAEALVRVNVGDRQEVAA